MHAIWGRHINSSLLRRQRSTCTTQHGHPAVRDGLRDLVLGLLGIGAATFGLKGFLLPNHFIDGGATGLALILTEVGDVPFALALALVNAPFIGLAHKFIGRRFAQRVVVAMTALALAVTLLDVPTVTHDKLLVAIFGGFFLGSGIGLAMRGGCVIDGTEVLAIHLGRKFRMTVGDVITLINLVVFTLAAALLSLESAMYSFITYLTASKTVNFIVDGIEEYTNVMIVSRHAQQIREAIVHKLGRGVTVLDGHGGYGDADHVHHVDVLVTVVTRLEIAAVSREIEAIDPKAFVTMHRLRDIRGGVVKKRAGHGSR